jgi:hypothetical protein
LSIFGSTRARGYEHAPPPTVTVPARYLYSNALDAAACSHAVRLMPSRLAAVSMRARTCVSKRRLIVAMPVSSS